MEQPSLLRHLDIDARGLRIGVSHHTLDRLDVYALFDHQRSERVPQRMRRNLRMRDADAGEALFDDPPDRLSHEPVVALRLVGYEERSVAVEVPIGDILLQPHDRIGMQHDDLVLVRTSLTLDTEDRLPLALGEVADVDTLRLACAKPVEEHQRNHQSVAAPDGGRSIDAVQQPERLLRRQWQFAVLRMAFAAADPCGDIVVVALSLAEAVKQLEDRNEAARYRHSCLRLAAAVYTPRRADAPANGYRHRAPTTTGTTARFCAGNPVWWQGVCRTPKSIRR